MLLVAFFLLVCETSAEESSTTIARDSATIVRNSTVPKIATTIKTLSAVDVAVRIVGGEITDIKKYPFAVSIQRRHAGHMCGGTYIAPRFVLSAAHCMVRPTSAKTWVPENPRRFYVIAGATYVYFPNWSSIQMELIDRTLPHLGFRLTDTMLHDIGLFRLRRPLRINAYVRYATMPRGVDNKLYEDPSLCVTIGWGRHVPGSNVGSGTYLRHVQVPLIPPSECVEQRVYPDSQLCAGLKQGGRDSCQGDSGGPLLRGNTQIGIVSHGEGCAEPNKPGIYTRVDFYLDWLNATVAKNTARDDNGRGAFVVLWSYCTIKYVLNYYTAYPFIEIARR